MSVKMKFHYVPEEEIENICFYKPGGYHPVKLGDIFQRGNCPAYRVLHKLGWGSFATVWLARDMLKRRYVALKILTAEATTQGNEVQLLVWLGKQSRDHPGYKHIPHVLDHFQVTGPNGMHDILVMEPMVSLSWVKYEDGNLIRSHAKTFIRQTMSGVSYLHMLGVMHGAFCLSDKRPLPHTPPYIRAPEIEIWERSKGKMAADWGIPADIWSLGCTRQMQTGKNVEFVSSTATQMAYRRLSGMKIHI
ncbi:hypothetical protein PRK78_004960 [Emydomyces testavorans]|uniref:non-specific serine/threonine protein kinase n=1 Tax=Emydomyces testavorans TaxID=2070801 RepID=A0AAF0IK98_9EURO|nr:hypothetical protein PRK78_004960 [Emydomyces testavorans]